MALRRNARKANRCPQWALAPGIIIDYATLHIHSGSSGIESQQRLAARRADTTSLFLSLKCALTNHGTQRTTTLKIIR